MSVANKLSQALVMEAVVGAMAGGGGGWPRVGWWVQAAGGMVGAGPPLAPAARARTGSVAGPVAGLNRDLASGIIGDLSASLVAGISLAVCVLSIFRVMWLHKPLGPLYTKKVIFFNEKILIHGRRGLSKHAPRHLPPTFVFQSRSISPRTSRFSTFHLGTTGSV